jgi:hypothetical protein
MRSYSRESEIDCGCIWTEMGFFATSLRALSFLAGAFSSASTNQPALAQVKIPMVLDQLTGRTE